MNRGIYAIIVVAVIFLPGSIDIRAESNSVSDANRTKSVNRFADLLTEEPNSVSDANYSGHPGIDISELIKKAENGDPNAQFSLGINYYFGNRVPQDYEQAVKWWTKAAEQGNAGAQYFLGMMYAKGEGVEQDYKESVKWCTKAAEQGDAGAQWLLADMYYYARGIAQDYQLAIKWYTRAAEQGYRDAQCQIGVIYYFGKGVPQDYQQAMKWFRKSAEHGQDRAQFLLGVMYYSGQYVERDYKEASKWYHRAAEQGNAGAQYFLGMMYAKGEGFEQDYKESVKWYRKSAEQGESPAQFDLGWIYATGEGVIEDYVEAYKWALLAGMNGLDVSSLKDFLQNRMTPEQISLAQQKAKEFAEYKEKNPDGKLKRAPEITKFGTGFFITKDGYMLTASHAVRDCSIISVYYQGKVKNGRKILDDSSLDVTLIKIDDVNCEWIAISPSPNVKVGDEVFTVGYPQIQLQGLGAKYTNGVINSLTGSVDDPKYFQISVPVQPGNSGGPLVDSRGRVIGIIVSRLDDIQTLLATGSLPQNVNYALKSSFVLSLLESVPQIAVKMKEEPIKMDKDKVIDNIKSAVSLIICSE